MAKDPKSILLDVQKELGGDYLEDTFQVGGHSYLMRMYNDAEFTWIFSKVDSAALSNKAALALQIRKPTLAVVIRAIDGVSVESMFEDEWNSLDDDQKETWINLKISEEEAKKYFSAELFLNLISKFPSSSINKLYEEWRKLEKRQETAKEEVKNSLGEDSVEDMKDIMTESSQNGKKSRIVLD